MRTDQTTLCQDELVHNPTFDVFKNPSILLFVLPDKKE